MPRKAHMVENTLLGPRILPTDGGMVFDGNALEVLIGCVSRMEPWCSADPCPCCDKSGYHTPDCGLDECIEAARQLEATEVEADQDWFVKSMQRVLEGMQGEYQQEFVDDVCRQLQQLVKKEGAA